MTTYYIDPATGSNGNSGTSLSSAWKTLAPISSTGPTTLRPGDRVKIRDTAPITPNSETNFSFQGTETNPITIEGYNGERPVIDCYKYVNDGSSMALDFSNTHHFHLRGIIVQNVAHNAIRFAGWGASNSTEHVVIEDVEIHHYGQSATWGGNGIICYGAVWNIRFNNVVCHHGAADGNSDGFYVGGRKSGDHNDNSGDHTFYRCDAYRNSDDGFDFFANDPNRPSVLIECRAWSNGDDGEGSYGDGNGFKMGGGQYTGGNICRRCTAWDNTKRGFDCNAATTPVEFINCTSFRQQYGYHFTGDTNGDHIAINCIAYQCDIDSGSSSNSQATTCTWTLGISDPKFKSTDPSDPNFLRLKADSPCINVGTPHDGVTHIGDAPDLGAYEYGLEDPEPEPTPEPTPPSNNDNSNAILNIRTNSTFKRPQKVSVHQNGEWVEASVHVYTETNWATAHHSAATDILENATLENFQRETARFTLDSTAPVVVGASSLKYNGNKHHNDGDGWYQVISMPDDGLPTYPEAGDTIRFKWRIASNNDRGRFAFAVQNATSWIPTCYALQIDVKNSSLHFQKGNKNTPDTWTPIGTPTPTEFTPYLGQVIDVEITWNTNGNLTATCYDNTGTPIKTTTGTDTDYTGGGIAFEAHSTGTMMLDGLTITKPSVPEPETESEPEPATTTYTDIFEETTINDWKGKRWAYRIDSQQPVEAGTTSLKRDGRNGWHCLTTQSNKLKTHTQAGDTIRFKWQINSPNDRSAFIFGVTKHDQWAPTSYCLRMDARYDHFRFQRGDGEWNFIGTNPTGTNLASYAGQTLTGEIKWGLNGTLIGRLYDPNGTLINETTATDTTIQKGGIGIHGHSPALLVLDAVTIERPN